MKSAVRILLLGVAGIAAFAAAAQAADMDAPLYESAPEVVPVEIGSGWYLRGDVSYAFETDVDVDYRTYTYDAGPPPTYVYGDESYDQFDLNDGVGFGLGAGYQFTDYFRGDLTANYWKHELGGTDVTFAPCTAVATLPSCRFEADDTAEVTAWELMANAYIDLGTFAGITPYVGAGAGAVHLEYDALKSSARCVNDPVNCPVFGGPVDHEGLDSWRFAYAVMAGASYDLAQNLKLDVGYRYLNVDEGDMFGFDTTAAGNGASGIQGVDGGFDRHTIQAGLRYSLF